MPIEMDKRLLRGVTIGDWRPMPSVRKLLARRKEYEDEDGNPLWGPEEKRKKEEEKMTPVKRVEDPEKTKASQTDWNSRAKRTPSRLTPADEADRLPGVPMRRVRMLVTREGSPNGNQVVLYEKGEVYDIPDPVALPWIASGKAEEV